MDAMHFLLSIASGCSIAPGGPTFWKTHICFKALRPGVALPPATRHSQTTKQMLFKAVCPRPGLPPAAQHFGGKHICSADGRADPHDYETPGLGRRIMNAHVHGHGHFAMNQPVRTRTSNLLTGSNLPTAMCILPVWG